MKPYRPAVPTRQQHLDLVLVNQSKQALLERFTFGFRSLFLFRVLIFILYDSLAVFASPGLTRLKKLKVSYIFI